MLTRPQKLWVKALRSGKYKQTQESLQDEIGYCCLGVLCDVYERKTGKTLPRNEDGELVGSALDNERKVVRKWAGLITTQGVFYSSTNSLVDMNDRGMTFKEIADVIESEPDGLFLPPQPKEDLK